MINSKKEKKLDKLESFLNKIPPDWKEIKVELKKFIQKERKKHEII